MDRDLYMLDLSLKRIVGLSNELFVLLEGAEDPDLPPWADYRLSTALLWMRSAYQTLFEPERENGATTRRQMQLSFIRQISWMAARLLDAMYQQGFVPPYWAWHKIYWTLDALVTIVPSQTVRLEHRP